MTDFEFNAYLDWISKNSHYKNTGMGPHNDVNINHASLNGERLNHPRIFRNTGVSSKMLNDVDEGGIESPYLGNSPGDTKIYVHHTDRFKAGEEILIQDESSISNNEIKTIASIVKDQYLVVSALANTYDKNELYTVSTIREFDLDLPDTGTYTLGDYVRIGDNEDYIIRKIEKAPVATSEKVTIYVARVTDNFSKDDLVSVIFPVNGIVPDIDDAIVIPEKTYPFNPQEFGIKAGSLHPITLKDSEGDETDYNAMTVETQSVLEFGAINVLFTPDSDDFSKFAQNLNFDNPMIMPGINTDNFDYLTDADMQKIWKGSTTTLDSNTLKWTYNSDSIYALFPLPLDFVARSGGDNEFSFNLRGTAGNTGSLTVILYSADGETFEYEYEGNLASTGVVTVSIDIDSFTGKQFIKSIEFRITSGTGVLYIDEATPFKVPSFDDIMGNPSGVVESNLIGSMAIYYDVREAPIYALAANASASRQTSIQLRISDTSEFRVTDKIVLYDKEGFEFAEVDSVDDATHITVIPVYGVFFYDYTTADFASVQLLTYKTRAIAGAYSVGSNLQTWTKTSILLEGTPTEWDQDSVQEPSALYKNNEVYLSYTGINSGVKKIGFAYSDNLVDFIKLPNNPMLSNYDNSKIIDLSGFQGITARNASGHIKLLKQISGWQNHPDLHVTLLVRPDSSLGDAPNDGMVLYDQGNFRIEINSDYTLSAYAYIEGQDNPISTQADDNNYVENCFGTELVKDHWNLIIAQVNGTKLIVYKVGLITYLGTHGAEYFKNGPWKFDADLASGATYMDITLDNENAPAPIADQAVYLYGFGYESGFEDKIHWQLNRITSVSEIETGLYRCNLLYPIGSWGFAKTAYGGSDMGPLLAQGVDLNEDWTKQYAAMAESTTGEFSQTFISDKHLEASLSSEKTQYLSSAKFSTPKIGSALDGTKVFTHGLIGHVDVASEYLSYDNILLLFAWMIQSNTNLGDIPLPEWWRDDISGTGSLPTMGDYTPIAYWDFSQYDAVNDRVPDQAHDWDLYNDGANFVSSKGYGYAVEFDDGENLIVYEFSNLTTLFNLLEAVTGTPEVASPVNLLPQSFEDGTALISTINGKLDYHTQATNIDAGYMVLDLFESTELPDELDIDGTIFNPAGCSLKLYLSTKKISSWNLIGTYASSGFVTIDETVDLSSYVGDDLIYSVRLKLELLTDGDDTTEIVDITASATGIVEFPSENFIDDWININSFPCLKVIMIDNEGTEYDVTQDIDNSKVSSIPNMFYQIPIYYDEQSQILPSDVTLTFENYNGFWNWNVATSPLNGKNYLDFKILILAGYDDEYVPQGVFKIERIILELNGTASVTCSSELREILDQKIGFEEPESFTGIWSAKDIINKWLTEYGDISPENIYFDDSLLDYFVEIDDIDDESIISLVRSLAQAANYLVYIGSQGEIRIINRADMDGSGNEYTSYQFNIANILSGAKLTSATRKNLIKKIKVTGSNDVSAIVENDNFDFGRHYTIHNDFIGSSDKAEIIANQIIADYGLTRIIMNSNIKFSPHLKLLDVLSFYNPFTGQTDRYMIMTIDRNLTSHTEKITAILL